MGKRATGLGILMLLVAACGDGNAGEAPSTSVPGSVTTTTRSVASTTTAPQGSTTTLASVTTTSVTAATAGSDPLGTVPAECIEPFQEFLIDLEPAASAYDFEAGSLHEWELFMIALVPVATELVGAYQQTDCMTADTGDVDPAIYPAVIEWTRQNAPGSLTYLEVTQEMAGLPNGDECSDYIGIHEDYVARGGTVFDLTRAERFHVYNTFGAITNWCGLRTAGEYTFRPEV
jgi:hypothetical protein